MASDFGSHRDATAGDHSREDSQAAPILGLNKTPTSPASILRSAIRSEDNPRVVRSSVCLVADPTPDDEDDIYANVRFDDGIYERAITADCPHRASDVDARHNAADPASHRIAIVYEGVDAQPYAALLLGLNEAGYATKMFTNASNVDLFRSLGVDVVGTLYDCDEIQVESSAPNAASTAFFQAKRKMIMDFGVKDIKATWQALEDFSPTIICHGDFSGSIAHVWSGKHDVPLIQLLLQNNLPTHGRPPTYMRNLPCNGNWIYHWLHMLESFKTCVFFLSKISDAIEENAFKYATPLSMMYFASWERTKFPGISFYGVSKHLTQVMPEWPTERVHHLGFWVLDQTAQDELVMMDILAAGGEEHMQLEDFLAAGDAPVCVGWGPMAAASAVDMVSLAIRALHASAKRGVLLGEWAQVGTGSLPAEMREYAAKSVLAVKAAPHEWLFPQCAAIVHHGGAGTTAASCRSGNPTIITPFFDDQIELAKDVNRIGAGVSFKQFGLVTPAALGEAIKRCTEDADVRDVARSLGEKLRAEDGVQDTVEALGRWLREEYASSTWLKRHEALMEEVRNPSPIPNIFAKPLLGFAILAVGLSFLLDARRKRLRR